METALERMEREARVLDRGHPPLHMRSTRTQAEIAELAEKAQRRDAMMKAIREGDPRARR